MDSLCSASRFSRPEANENHARSPKKLTNDLLLLVHDLLRELHSPPSFVTGMSSILADTSESTPCSHPYCLTWKEPKDSSCRATSLHPSWCACFKESRRRA